ncbi:MULTISPECIES: hypothetical protein [unclassified Aurantimonas]|uniref:hypothetical protein n=1 Tax=unclassified Aurantimonas TaxID=2638230 RepID=UPI002E17F06F|nr:MULTISPECIES: hypothetical protein [unclassified Aurantimonas]MEC5291564.1 hypothetical protein [Aurantimonas sp. C2-3-R2]MEC5412648.1 hypothetical protein [Aurantimonas sp. C2-4-R8]
MRDDDFRAILTFACGYAAMLALIGGLLIAALPDETELLISAIERIVQNPQ